MTLNPAFDSRTVDILIRLDYFREFGTPGKLLNVYRQFAQGEFRFSKTHVQATQEKRLAALRRMEQNCIEEELPLADRLRFEAEHMGTPLTVCESERAVYVVLEVDDRYSPKLRLYSVATGNVGVMKVKKAAYQQQPLSEGNVILVMDWFRRPAYSFSTGKPRPIPGQQELWLREYAILS